MSHKIITVDDSATIRRMVVFTLKESGQEVLEAGDGVEGLALLKAHKIELIFTDVNMPNMNGLEFTRQVRALPGYASVPIILLTTESDPTKKAEGKAAGATGLVVKPFSPEQLKAILARVFPNG